ncbi:hypothetical protein CK627_09690 [Aeromonas dhakensis]|nr:hypothetical protein CK627_09690 [Aeromonas dhakensis]
MQAPFFMRKCFGFNSYYHINPQGLPTLLYDAGQPSTLQQLTHHNLRISFLNSTTTLFHP